MGVGIKPIFRQSNNLVFGADVRLRELKCDHFQWSTLICMGIYEADIF